MASEDSQWEWMDPAQNGFGFKVPGDNAWYDSRNDMVGPDGRMWARVGTQDEVGMAPDAYTQYMQSQYGIDVPSMTRDGAIWAPHDALVQAASKANAGDGFMQKFLNGPGPVLALSGGLLGAVGAAGGFSGLGASGLEGAAGAAPTTVAGAPPSSYWSMLAGEAPEATGEALAAATGGGGGAEGGFSLYGGNAGGANLFDIPGLGNVDLGSLTGEAGSGAGNAGAFDLTGPLTTGGSSGGDNLFSLFNGMGLPPGTSTALQALSGGNGPTQSGFNLLDPSTYGGAGSAAGGLLSGLSSAFPNANLGSLLSGLGQGALGYLGAKQQSDALERMQDKWLALGAPSRARLEGSYQPGFDITQEPGFKGAAQGAADASARSYSATSGNPYDQPSAQGGIFNTVLQNVALPQLNTYRSQNLTGGQFGLNTAGTAGLQQANQAGGGLDAIGYGLGSALNPQLSAADLLKQASNYSFNAGK